MSTPLRVVSIQARGILGITEGAIEPGRVTLISAKNGFGKTSWLDALLAGLGGGSLAKIAHVGPDGKAKPEVVIVLKGGQATGWPEREYRVTKKSDETAKVMARVGESQAFEDIPEPDQAWLSSRFDAGACSIVKLLKAKDADLATLILEALPLQLDREELASILAGVPLVHWRPVPKGLHALEELGLVRDDVFTARTGVNRDKDAAKKAAEQLRRALPAVLPADHVEECAKLQRERDALAEQIAAERQDAAAAEEQAVSAARHAHEIAEQGVKASFLAAKEKLMTAHNARAVEINADAERRIVDIRKAAADEVAQSREATHRTIDALRESDLQTMELADTERDDAISVARKTREVADFARAEAQARLNSMDQQLGALTRDAEAAHRAAGLVEQVDKFDKSAAAYTEDSARLTATLEALDAYRLRLAKSLPVPGLEISGPLVTVDGVAWQQLNKAQRVKNLVKIGVLRAQGMPLPLILVDDAETLDSENLGLVVEELKAAGIQALISRVTDTPFQVETLA